MRYLEPALERPELHSDAWTAGAAGWRIIRPERNCWRVAEAGRAAVLVDGGPYFAHLEDALRQAQRSILIIGWDFDGRIRLRPDVDDQTSPPLGPLLRSLVEARPDLEIRILVWSVAVIHAPGAPLPLLFGAEWQDHPRIRLKLDTRHPKYAAHHQKIICIDESLAFVGGIDLTVRRWDRKQHLAHDPVRLSPEGEPYSPVHDIQMVVDGDAARALCALGRSRWQNATGEAMGDCPPYDGLWPSALEPHFTETPVAVARTAPSWDNEPCIMEAAVLTTDALRAAQRTIYIEAQYMTAPYVGDVLAESLARKAGPEVIVLMTHLSRGLLERLVMGRNRDRLIRRLKRADRYNRFRVYYPVVPRDDGEQQVMVHSKLIIVDDLFIRVGSSNLNNRSIGLDTECDLGIEATTDAARAAIASIQRQLVAEHLDAEPATVAKAIAATGSVIAAIERLNTRPRGLRPFEAMSGSGPDQPVFGTGLLDPKRPFEPLSFLRGSKRQPSR
jgi:phosphatidylserine/phosphatidylglycerophosphate/cardiolipin synthase-like enzyme